MGTTAHLSDLFARPGGCVVAIDGLRWAGNCRPDPTPQTKWQTAFANHYSSVVRASLPLMDAQSTDAIVSRFVIAGFAGVRVSRLDGVERHERASAPDEPHTDRYVISTARQE